MVKERYFERTHNSVINHQLFSATYLRELRKENQSDKTKACYQNICEWQAVYPALDDDRNLQQYVGYCLTELGFLYTSQQSDFTLHIDSLHGPSTGICLVVNDSDLGCTIKGSHHQVNLIKRLQSASLHWGIITNGKHWRLCHTASATPYEVFLEIDLASILQNASFADFILFYLLFGYQAFMTRQTKIDGREQFIGLDLHLKNSEKCIDTVQRYLRSSIEGILQSLCLGFVQDEAANVYTREDFDRIYCNAIFLLYRILFLFYVEAHGILPIHDSIYQYLSLASIMEKARQYQQEGKHHENAFSLWEQFTKLCKIVDKGESNLKIRPYNGGLFSNKEHPYFQTHKITDAYLAPTLFALGYLPEKNKIYTPIDYDDLSVRHLGSLYESLLEYQLYLVTDEPVVVRESDGKRLHILKSQAGTIRRNEAVLEVGKVYFADDKGERKSSGSYYTPDDVVQYIVSHTVLPKLQERCRALDSFLMQIEPRLAAAASMDELHQLRCAADDKIVEIIEHEILSLRILDPAMGSGHFLNAAGQVLTNFIVETLNTTTWVSPSINSDPLFWKRRVVERCLYGVDINPLAHELTKLALWLNSVSEGKPLTFLDHHLKRGNSLYGVPVSRLSTLLVEKKTNSDEWYDNERFQQKYEQIVQATLVQLNEITGYDSQHIDDVKRKGDIQDAVNKAMQGLRDIAHVWLASLLKDKGTKTINEDVHRRYLVAFMHSSTPEAWETYVQSQPVLQEARKIAEHERFFHWEIEFPDTLVNGECRFDIIITNPPYVRSSPNRIVTNFYKTAKCGDLYAWFFEKVLKVRDTAGAAGLVVPLSLTFGRQFASLRELLLHERIELYCSSFDNTPDVLFKENAGSENQQRATIITLRATSGRPVIKTTDLLRWQSTDRPFLFTHLHYADTTSLSSSLSFPRIGNDLIALFWTHFKSMKRSFADLRLETFGETHRPSPGSISLTVPRAVRYFISATPGPMARSKVLSFSFENENDMNLMRVLLNSNIFYWYWRAFGDGFCLGVDLVEVFPVPDCVDSGYIDLAKQLDAIQEQCITSNELRGKKIPGYNFNKRIDILIDIDEWIIKQVIPEIRIPKDLFAQYKSNSFLRPYTLAGMPDAEEELVMEA